MADDPTPADVVATLTGDPDPDEADVAELLVIVLALDDSDPTAYDTTRGQGIRCVLCDAEPPGTSAVLIQDRHREYCPWRRAREYSEKMRRDASASAHFYPEGTDAG